MTSKVMASGSTVHNYFWVINDVDQVVLYGEGDLPVLTLEVEDMDEIAQALSKYLKGDD